MTRPGRSAGRFSFKELGAVISDGSEGCVTEAGTRVVAIDVETVFCLSYHHP